MWIMFCFFFKQKTAYEMRISDWSSDVCSSDLGRRRLGTHPPPRPAADARTDRARDRAGPARAVPQHLSGVRRHVRGRFGRAADQTPARAPAAKDGRLICGRDRRRSEEHTSELHSLMRISYAVFCLKKQTK